MTLNVLDGKISSEQYSRVEENASMTSGVTWADWLETVEG